MNAFAMSAEHLLRPLTPEMDREDHLQSLLAADAEKRQTILPRPKVILLMNILLCGLSACLLLAALTIGARNASAWHDCQKEPHIP